MLADSNIEHRAGGTEVGVNLEGDSKRRVNDVEESHGRPEHEGSSTLWNQSIRFHNFKILVTSPQPCLPRRNTETNTDAIAYMNTHNHCFFVHLHSVVEVVLICPLVARDPLHQARHAPDQH